MTLQVRLPDRDRVKSAAGVAAVHALIGYALLVGLGVSPTPDVPENLKLIALLPEPPPPPQTPPPPPPPPPTTEPAARKAAPKEPRTPEPEGAASPKNLRDTPSPVVVPPPVIPLPVPTPVVAAPIAGTGNRPSAGASDVPGPGTGSGGQGTGLGSGSAGSGTGGGGGGGGGGMGRGARLISGRINRSDYPPAAVMARAQGTVYLRFVVAPTGRVTACTVTRSSGNPDLDETTCRLITQRLRYRPARDAQGNPIEAVIRGEHEWELAPEPPPIDVEPTIEDDE